MPDASAEGVFEADISEFMNALGDLEDGLARIEQRFADVGGSATTNLQGIDSATGRMASGLQNAGVAGGAMTTLGGTLVQVASAARIAVGGLSLLGPYIGGLPDSVSRVVGPLKQMFASIGVTDAATKAFSGRLGVLGSVFAFMDARTLGASRAMAGFGAASGLALSKMIALARTAVTGVAALARGVVALSATAMTALAPLAAVGGPFLLLIGAIAGIKSALDLGGEFTDLRAQTGESISNLVILKQAFENAGLGGDGVQASINRLQKSLGGLNEEGKSTAAALKELGLSSADLGSKSALDQVEALQKAFVGIEDAGRRTEIAQALFGKSGGKMLSLLGDPGSLEAARAQTGKLGMELEKNAAIFDQTSDNIGAMKVKFQQLFVGVASGLAPSLSVIFDQLARTDWTDVGKRIGELVPHFVNLAVNIARALEWLSKFINKTLDFFGIPQASSLPEAEATDGRSKLPLDSVEKAPKQRTFGGVIAIGNLGAGSLISESRKQTRVLEQIYAAMKNDVPLSTSLHRPPVITAI